jgi:hypothetical protein
MKLHLGATTWHTDPYGGGMCKSDMVGAQLTTHELMAMGAYPDEPNPVESKEKKVTSQHIIKIIEVLADVAFEQSSREFSGSNWFKEMNLKLLDIKNNLL